MTSPCDTCPTSRCCIVFDPELTGADLYRLCRARGLDPLEVATLAPVRLDEAGPDAIAFADDGCGWELRLARTRSPRGNGGRRRCQFLVGLGPGVNRCGVYRDRPMLCRLYPSDRTPFGLMVGSPRPVCPPGAWDVLRADVPALLATHEVAASERALHRAFLARWNACARAASWPAPEARARFFTRLFHYYDVLAARPDRPDPALALAACFAELEPVARRA